MMGVSSSSITMTREFTETLKAEIVESHLSRMVEKMGSAGLNVSRGIPQSRMHTLRPLIRAIKHRRVAAMVLRQRTEQIRPTSLAQEIRVVSRWTNADGFRGAVEEVA